MRLFVYILVLSALGCGTGQQGDPGAQGEQGLEGSQGAIGATGPEGQPGAPALSCHVSQGILGVLITCPDGSTAFIPALPIPRPTHSPKGHPHD